MWKRKNDFYYKTWMEKPKYNNQVEERVYDDGIVDLLKNEKNICGFYILDGTIKIYDQRISPDTLLWMTGGATLSVLTEGCVHAIFIETGKLLNKDTAWRLYKENDIAWSRNLHEAMTASRHMIKAEEDGVKIQTCIYTKGFQHMSHSHKYAHLIYVLDGMLEQKSNLEDKIYGPHEAALAEAGEEVLHTLAPAASYCHYLFIGDGIFDFIVDGKNMYQ